MNRVRLVLAGTLAAATLFAGTVMADADPDAVTKARQELEQIQQKSSAVDQEIIEAHERATENGARLVSLKADVTSQEKKVADLSAQLGDVGALQMQTDSVSLTAQLLLGSDSENFLSGLGAMQAEADRSNAGIQKLQLDQAKLTTLREDAAATQAQLDKDAAAKVSLGKDYDALEADAKAVYDRLSAEERARLAAEEAARVAAAERAQADAEARTSQAPSRSQNATDQAAPSAPSTDTQAPGTGAGSDRAQQVVDAALSKVGSSYVWGTSGPNTFDCSGLTSWAYRQIGVNITRSSRGQYSSVGSKVSKSELRPGDLVFYYSPVSHVGLYIGGGKIVDAANPRAGVRVTSLDSMPFAGARRVLG